ncbi:MAG: hypothetical protein MPN21_02910 [Thermoanaerobaculia bacterium]|nr:hypothetical protein [Thermoanaerobaculia bacterium]
MSKPASSPEARQELLSAYLDGELRPDEEKGVEDLLEQEPAAREQLEGMRRVVGHLRHVERMAPPQTLDMAVARRVALEGEHRSLLDRIEDGMGGMSRAKQGNLFFLFALVVALAVIILLFSQGLQRSQDSLIPVVFEDPSKLEDADLTTALQVVVGGALFRRHEGQHRGVLWVEDGLEVDAEAELVLLGSERAEELLTRYPELKGIAMLGHVKVEVAGRILELVDDSSLGLASP